MIKVNYIKNKNNKLILFPLIMAFLSGIILIFEIKNHQFNDSYINELLLNMNSFMPAFLGIISKIIISFPLLFIFHSPFKVIEFIG